MKINEIRKFVRTNIEPFAGSKASIKIKSNDLKSKVIGMLSSTWQQSIPVCTVRTSDANNGSCSIPFKLISDIKRTTKRFDTKDLLECDIDLESRGQYLHTSKDRIVFEFTLKNKGKAELWINPNKQTEYASVQNILNKMQS